MSEYTLPLSKAGTQQICEYWMKKVREESYSRNARNGHFSLQLRIRSHARRIYEDELKIHCRMTHPEAFSGRFLVIVTKTDSYRVASIVEHLPRTADLFIFQNISVPDTLVAGM